MDVLVLMVVVVVTMPRPLTQVEQEQQVDLVEEQMGQLEIQAAVAAVAAVLQAQERMVPQVMEAQGLLLIYLELQHTTVVVVVVVVTMRLAQVSVESEAVERVDAD
jgi:hypothetical protein